MYITAMPVIATSAMAENHIKTNSIGLQLQAECCYEQEELPQALSSTCSLYHRSTTASHYISDHKNAVRKTRTTTVRRGCHAWTSLCLHKRGGVGQDLGQAVLVVLATGACVEFQCAYTREAGLVCICLTCIDRCVDKGMKELPQAKTDCDEKHPRGGAIGNIGIHRSLPFRHSQTL